MQKYKPEILISYLEGTLDSAKEAKIRIALKNDLDLQKELEMQKSVLAYIQLNGDLELKNHLKEILPTPGTVRTLKPKNKLRNWALAAAAALALLFVLSQVLFQRPATGQELFANHYTAYDLNFGLRGASTPSLNQQAGAFYITKNYKEAIPLFQSLLDNEENGKYRLALGISQLETNQFDSALETFQVLIDNQNPVFESHARWYAALAHLQQNQVNSAHQELKIIAANPEAYQHEAAKKILSEDIFQEK